MIRDEATHIFIALRAIPDEASGATQTSLCRGGRLVRPEERSDESTFRRRDFGAGFLSVRQSFVGPVDGLQCRFTALTSGGVCGRHPNLMSLRFAQPRTGASGAT
jgi:hypothetical protein